MEMPGDMTPRTWAANEDKCIEGDNDCCADVDMILINTSHLVNRNKFWKCESTRSMLCWAITTEKEENSGLFFILKETSK